EVRPTFGGRDRDRNARERRGVLLARFALAWDHRRSSLGTFESLATIGARVAGSTPTATDLPPVSTAGLQRSRVKELVMPLRVHCRCGQEVIVRYSEWVHVVLGLAILATIANVIVAIILFRDVRRLESEVEERVARVIEARESDALAKNAAGEERRAPTEASGAVRSGDDGSGGDAAKRAQPPSQGPTLAGSNE